MTKLSMAVLCAALLLSLILATCQKKSSELDSNQLSTLALMSTADLSNLSKDLKVEDGILVFPDGKSFQSLLELVNGMPDDQKNAWETSIGFKSARKKYQEIVTDISNCQTKEELEEVLEKEKKFILINGDEIQYITGNPYFASIANELGIIKIGPAIYRFYDYRETISLDGSIDDVINASQSEESKSESNIYRFPISGGKIHSGLSNKNGTLFSQGSNNTLSGGQLCSSGDFVTCQTSGSKRKGFHDFEYDLYWILWYDVFSNPDYWEVKRNVRLRFGAHKKVLGSWHSYATSYSFNSLNYSDNESHNVSAGYTTSGGNFVDWYYPIVSDQATYDYIPGQPLPPNYCSPYVYSFTCYGCTTGGTIPNTCDLIY